MDYEWYNKIYLRDDGSLFPREPIYVEPDLSAPALRVTNLSNGVSGPERLAGPLIHLRSTIITLEDLIDTDALAPGHTLTTCSTDD